MKNISIILLLAILCSGCSSTGYMANRGRDAADIFTLTLGAGMGVKVRVGPAMLAANQNSDLIGLRSGKFFVDGNGLVENDEFYLPIPLHPVFPLTDKYKRGRSRSLNYPDRTQSAIKDVKPRRQVSDEEIRRWKEADRKLQAGYKEHPNFADYYNKKRPSKWSDMFGTQKFSHGVGSISDKRNKDVAARSPFPLVAIGKKAPFYTDVEIMAGFIFSFRAGANAGELLDFILGWTGIDIYGDDL